MQRQEYPPPPSLHHDTSMASGHAPVRQQQAGGPGGTLPPHMVHSHPGYAPPQHPQQPRSNYQAPPTAAGQQDQRADPLPPHLQHVASTQSRGGPSGQTTAARPSGVPDHLQPRPFSQQRDVSPRRRLQGQGQGVQQPKLSNPQQQAQQSQQQAPLQQQQAPLQQQAMLGHYPPQGTATGVRHPGPSPEQIAVSGPARAAPAVGVEAAYQAHMPYVSGGGNAAPPAATPALDAVPDATGQATGAQTAGWYHTTGAAQHTQAQTGHYSASEPPQRQQLPQQQQQQRSSYDTEYQQAPVYAAAPAAPQQHLQQSQPQQAQQQYPPPPAQQHAPPPQQQQHQYQQQPYQQPSRPLPADDADVRQAPLGQQPSGQVPSLSGQAPALHGTTTGANNTSAAPAAPPEALQYPPPPPVQLKPASVEVTATPVSFVQLVPQTAGIQIDHCGAVRVVATPAPQEAAATVAGSGLGQPAMPPSQHAAAAAYGSAPPQQQQQQQQQQGEPHAQPQRYGSMSGPSPALSQHPQPPQPQQQHMAREAPLPSAVGHSYDLSPVYQQPGTNGGPPGPIWDEAAVHRDAPPAYATFASPRLDRGGDGRAYLPAAAERPRPLPPTVQLPQDGGYVVYDDSAAGRYQSAAGVASGVSGGVGGQERRSSRAQALELDGMAIDAYAASPGVQRLAIERLGSRGDGGGGGFVEAVPQRRPSGGGGGRGPTYSAVAEEPPLPLAEATRRAEALVAAVAATRVDGELMSGMLPQLLQTCEKRMHDLSCSLRIAKTDASAARAAADAAKAAAAKAAADAAEAAAAEDDEELGNVRAGHFAFLLERSIRTVWPLDTPEHQLYRVVAETLLLEEGGRVVPVNNEEVRLKPHEMVGATLCNVPAVQDKVAEVRATKGASTMTLLRDSKVSGFFDIKEHTHKQDPRSLQWLVRLKAEKLPSYAEVRRVLRFAIDALLPPTAAAAAPTAGARKSTQQRSSTKPEQQQQQQPQRPSSGQLPSSSPARGGRSSFTGGDGGSSGGASLQLPFVSREPEGEEERQVLRHVALHLLSCKGKEIGLFQDKIETAAEKLPPHLAKIYGKGRAGQAVLQQLLKSHPFFWVSTKSVYGPDGLTCSSHACVSLHSNTILEFACRAKLVQEQEQEVAHQSKRRRTGPVGTADASGGAADGADCARALEAWWQDMRSLRPSLHALGGGV